MFFVCPFPLSCISSVYLFSALLYKCTESRRLGSNLHWHAFSKDVYKEKISPWLQIQNCILFLWEMIIANLKTLRRLKWWLSMFHAGHCDLFAHLTFSKYLNMLQILTVQRWCCSLYQNVHCLMNCYTTERITLW